MENFLKELEQLNLFLIVKNGDLILKGRKEQLSKDEIEKVKNNHFIIDFIKGNKESLVNHLTRETRKKKQLYKLSPLQEGILFHHVYDPHSSAYIEQFIVDVPTELNVAALVGAWNHVLKSYTILRTSFVYDEVSVPLQYVHNHVQLPFELIDYTDLSKKVQKEKYTNFLAADFEKGFDIRQAPLMRVTLLKFANNQFKLVWTHHHLILDGWSLPIVIVAFITAYNALDKGESLIEKEEDRYEDYIKYIYSQNRFQPENFWKKYLEGWDTPCLIPFVAATPDRNKGIGSTTKSTLNFDTDLSNKVKAYAQSINITVNTLIQGVWSYLLSQYSGIDDVVFGVTVSGRPIDLEQAEHKVGLYINMIPVRSKIGGHKTVAEWLTQLQNDQASAREYQFTRLTDIRQWSGIKGDLFDSILVFENYPMGELLEQDQGQLKFGALEVNEQTNYLLTILAGIGEKLVINFQYYENLLERYYVERIKGHFEAVIRQIVTLEVDQIASINLLTEQEQNQLLHDFNDTEVNYKKNETVIDLFDQQSLKTPQRTALVFRQKHYSYEAVNKLSFQLAQFLLAETDFKKGDSVGVLMDRSEWSAIAMVGILRLGGVYVPLDVDFPESRLSYVIDNSSTNILIINGELKLKALADQVEFVLDLENGKAFETNRGLIPEANLLWEDPSYIIYTSGSTGQPKGVEQTQLMLYNLIRWEMDVSEVQNGQKHLQYSSFGFDSSLQDIFFEWSAGGTIFIVEESMKKELWQLKEYIIQHEIATVSMPYAGLKLLFEEIEYEDFAGHSIKELISTGEQLYINGGLRAFLEKEPTIKIHNFYGPSETHVVTAKTYSFANGAVPVEAAIGATLSNTTIYIVDENKHLVPVGVEGEIYAGGANLALGYKGNAQATKERFLEDPFKQGAQVYKTGDIGKWLPDGNIAYKGRQDDQVKIRGFRVELGEIESLLGTAEQVKNCAVVARSGTDGVLHLVAYVVLENKTSETNDWDKTELQAFLSNRLPTYMIPAIWIELEALPLTPTGKIHKKSLPSPDIGFELKKQYVAPENEIEQKLCQIWQSLFKVEKIGTQDDFFEIGGHSLMAMRLVSAIRKQFEQEVKVVDVFTYPTISKLANYLKNKAFGLSLPSIVVANKTDQIPLSFAQERLWLIHQLEGSVQYHLPSVFRFTNDIDKGLLEKTFVALIERHEALRTIIKEAEDARYQMALPAEEWTLHFEERNFRDESAFQQFIAAEIRKPFDLENDYMMRARLVKCGPNDYVLLLVMHHIASDGWSQAILLKDLLTIYEAYKTGKEPELSKNTLRYADYALWQRNHYTSDYLEDGLKWWAEKLEGLDPLSMPTDYARSNDQRNEGGSVRFNIAAPLTRQLKTIATKNDASLFMTLLTAFKVLLYRYSGHRDICVGTPIANRNDKEMEQLVGYFVNTLALRSELSENVRFTDLLKQVSADTLSAFNHSAVPFEQIVSTVVKDRTLGRTPIFQVMFIMQNLPEVPSLSHHDLALESTQPLTTQFELSISVMEKGGQLWMELVYDKALFKQTTIDRMGEHFQNLLQAIGLNPTEKIDQLSLFSESEKQQVLYDFNDTTTDFPKDKTLVDLIQLQATASPNEVAIVFEGQSLTYKALAQRSNELANDLKQLGVTTNTLVGICIDRSLEMMIGLLGILKAGAAYVPIDSNYPQERIDYILKDTASRFVLTTQANEAKLQGHQEVNLLLLDQLLNTPSEGLTNNIPSAVAPNDLAYVIYTSGSTGNPKGVMNQHSGVVNRLQWAQQHFQLRGQEDVVLQKTTYCFDVSVWELFWPLIAGVKMVLARPGGEKDVDYLKAIIDREKVTVMHFVPSLLEAFLDGVQEKECQSLRWLICSGEALRPAHVAKAKTKLKNTKVSNLYGPTEAAIDVSFWDVPNVWSGARVPIGSPVANTQLYLLNQADQINGIGIAGELCIGGIQVARGYLNRPELSAEKFIDHPFDPNASSKLYRTGDLAKWTANGQLEYLGRLDDQVKIRGNRIELGELEIAISQFEAVKHNVVTVHESKNGHQQLVAYVVPSQKATDDAPFEKEALLAFLKKKLPVYMLPTVIIVLEHLPLMPNGKANKKLLPAPIVQLKNEFKAANSKIEQSLTRIWQDLLNVEQIGVEDNFFELGGDSIVSIQVVNRARQLGIYLHPRDIFEHRNIQALAKNIRHSNLDPNAEQGLLDGPLDLLPIQHWFLQSQQVNKSHFNQSQLFDIDKNIEGQDLDKIFKTLVAHHDALRMVFEQVDGHWMASYGDQIGELFTEDLKDEEHFNSELARICNHYQGSLSIEKGELIKAVWVKTPSSQRDNRLFIVVHHLAIDGVSWRILSQQIQEMLAQVQQGQAFDLGRKTSSYRQWGQFLVDFSSSDTLSTQLNYWKKIAKAYTPIFPSTASHMDASTGIDQKDNHTFHLDQQSTEYLLKEVHQAYNTEVNDLLLAALIRTLGDWSEQDQLLIGMEGHGREAVNKNVDVSATLGWFTTLYPVQFKRLAKESDQIFLQSVKETIRAVPNKGLGFGVLRYLHPSEEVKTDLAKAKWDVLYNYLGQVDNDVKEQSGLKRAKESTGNNTGDGKYATHQLEVNAIINKTNLILNWQYRKAALSKTDVEQLAERYITNLKAIIEHCRQRTTSTYTPSDYGLNPEVSYRELNTFLSEKTPAGQAISEDIENLCQLSPLQQGMLFHHLFEGKSKAYLEQLRLDFPEGVDIAALEMAFNHLIKKYSIFRSCFLLEPFKIPVLCTYKEASIPVRIIDFSKKNSAEQTSAYQDFLSDDLAKGIDFETVPLMRVTLIKITEKHYKMIWTYHHILLDGWSLPIVLKELREAYSLFAKQLEPVIDQADRYENFIKYIQQQDPYESERFWKNYLQEIEELRLLPFATSTSNRNRGDGEVHHLDLILSKETTAQIQKYAAQHQLTVNTIVQGLWGILLSKYAGSQEVMFGVTVSGRPTDLAHSEDRVGLYINTIPLPIKFEGEQRLKEWLGDIQLGQMEARDHQYVAINKIQNWIGLTGDLFDSILVFENYPVQAFSKAAAKAMKVSNIAMEERTNYMLTLTAVLQESLSIKFSFNTDLLEQYYVELMKNHFEQLFQQLLNENDVRLHQLKILAPAEATRLQQFNATDIAFPTDQSIVDLFAEQVKLHPKKIALVFEHQEISYEELNTQSNQLAHFLRKRGIVEDTLVGICVHRSINMMVGILGILKAGGAYVPIDPAYPLERTKYILSDTAMKYVLCNEDSEKAIGEHEAVEKIVMDRQWPTIAQESKEEVRTHLSPANLIYVIYTSGSTGQPKGVMNQHSGLVNRLLWAQEHYQLKADRDVLLQKTTYCFDVSAWEIFWPLITGVKLVLAAPGGEKDIHYLKQLIEKERITMLHFVPSMLDIFLQQMKINECPSIKWVLCSGEALKANHIQSFKEKMTQARLANLYGPTEAAIDVSYWDIPSNWSGERVPIGQAVGNTKLFVLNDHGSLNGIGVPGELAIAGVQVARGYLNQPELTAKKFIHQSFDGAEGQRMYKTGDIAKWDKDGLLDFLGRSDDQVKIRGNRVELGEIEFRLNQLPYIEQCVVVVNEDKNDIQQLIAYVVQADNWEDHSLAEIDALAIKSYLQSKLPHYMIPSAIVEISTIPLTPNGKLDRKALPQPSVTYLSKHKYTPPRNEVEKQLVQIMADLLGMDIKEVGVENNFYDLGANSLIMLKALFSINKISGQELKITDLYQFPNIRSLYQNKLSKSSQLEESSLDDDVYTSMEDFMDLIN